MNPLNKLVLFLDEVFKQEVITPEERGLRAGYIVGELLGDYDGVYKELHDSNPKVEEIGDLASDLEWSNGSEAELDMMWRKIIALTSELKSDLKRDVAERDQS